MLRVLGRDGLVRDLLAGDSRHDTGGAACQLNSWSGVGDGGTCLQSTNRFKVWGKLLAGVP